ncbi:hypothetical protein M0805_008413 [Coniferiporia weirii]|nr:hypothetical protein M0805_008413 [Coniferiporia weirii]
MAQTPSDSGSAGNPNVPTLARGKACLRCRKRKMRCDGAKPACAQCVRAHKTDVCIYDDGRGKTRTQALREKIARLEEEIAQLRDPESTASLHSQSIFLHDPHAQMTSPSGLSSTYTDSRPATSQGHIGGSSPTRGLDFDAFELNLVGSTGERAYSGGVQRSSTRPLSGTYSNGCARPHARAHRRTSAGGSSAGSSPLGSPSPSTVDSVALSASGAGASPYSVFNDSLNSPPVNSPAAGYSLPRTLSPSVLTPAQADSVEVPQEICIALFDVFLAHRHQAGFALHVERLRTSLGSSGAQPRHPVLLNAMLLWASLIMRGSPLDAYERTFLVRTQAALADALNVSQFQTHTPADPNAGVAPATAALDALQASVLLARYFFACARLTEASYHASAAADLAVQCGLHQLRGGFSLGVFGSDFGSGVSGYEYDGGLGMSSSALHLSPPVDAVELGERIGVFWQVYVLDRMLSVALRRPPCIVDDDCVETRIDTPWPEEIQEYENIPMETIQSSSTLRMFFLNQAQPTGVSGGFSLLGLRVKAAALYSAAARAVANWGLRSTGSQATGTSSPQMDSANIFGALEYALVRFAGALLPAHQLGAALPDEDRRTHVCVHTLMHAAVVLLNVRFARAGEQASLEKCVRSARAAAMLIRHLTDADYEFLDPTFGPCWTTIASVFSLEQVQTSAATSGSPSANWVPQDLDTILTAMTRLGARFPIMGM